MSASSIHNFEDRTAIWLWTILNTSTKRKFVIVSSRLDERNSLTICLRYYSIQFSLLTLCQTQHGTNNKYVSLTSTYDDMRQTICSICILMYVYILEKTEYHCFGQVFIYKTLFECSRILEVNIKLEVKIPFIIVYKQSFRGRNRRK